MKNLLKLPKTVLAAITFLTVIVIVGMILLPWIIIPLMLIVTTVASFMRIFIYMVHGD